MTQTTWLGTTTVSRILLPLSSMPSTYQQCCDSDTPTGPSWKLLPGSCLWDQFNNMDVPNAMLAVYAGFEREFLVISELSGAVRALVCGGWKKNSVPFQTSATNTSAKLVRYDAQFYYVIAPILRGHSEMVVWVFSSFNTANVPLGLYRQIESRTSGLLSKIATACWGSMLDDRAGLEKKGGNWKLNLNLPLSFKFRPMGGRKYREYLK